MLEQAAERFQAKRVLARDRWHLMGRWLRMMVRQTLAGFLCQEAGLPPLTFAELITD